MGSVPSQLKVLGRRMLVWFIAIASGLQTMTQTMESLYFGYIVVATFWAAATILLVVLAINMERVKAFVDE